MELSCAVRLPELNGYQSFRAIDDAADGHPPGARKSRTDTSRIFRQAADAILCS
jgi:hypothetical protein